MAKAVYPLRSLTLGSAPAFRSTSTTSSKPRLAASLSGVCPHSAPR